jgi:hypothetical protein
MPANRLDGASRSVSLLVSVLVRYPEVAAVDFHPAHHTIKFTFLLRRRLTGRQFHELAALLTDSLAAFAALEGRTAGTVQVEQQAQSGVTVVSITRDVPSLTQGEISLVVAIMRERWGRLLAADSAETMQEDELMVQEEIIAEMLEDVRANEQERTLTAFRDDGRVVVFNK